MPRESKELAFAAAVACAATGLIAYPVLWTILTPVLGTVGKLLSGIIPLSMSIVALALALRAHPARETWRFRVFQAVVVILSALAAVWSISWLIGVVGSATLDYRRNRS